MIKIVSLFSGCGGSDLGVLGGFTFLGKKYDKLPVKIVFATDIDTNALATYNLNFNHYVLERDIKQIKSTEIPDCDIVTGGFPCQSFSTVNPTKDPFDDRGELYKEMARILKDKKPKAFIAENVKGMARLHKGKILNSILKSFKEAGYIVDFAIFNAADYGVPQKRERVFIVGIRNDIKTYDNFFPESTHSENGINRKKWVPLKKVVRELVNVDKKYYFSKKAVEGMKRAKNNMKRGLAQDLNGPSLTITSHLAKVSINSRDPVLLVNKSKETYRRFAPSEAAAIQSFPKDFKFSGSEAKAYYQIGQAIPPVMMWHISRHLIKLLDKAEVKENITTSKSSDSSFHPAFVE